jgi:predicted RNA-binding protein with PIN domain
MAYILIDGYNLIGVGHENFEKARSKIIHELQQYASLKKHDITIVFDGWKSGMKDQTRNKAGHVTTIYSRLGENADTVIKKMLSSAEKPWIVISSDREISDYAFKKDYAAVHSEEFEFKLYSALRNVQSNKENTDEISLENEIKKYYEDEFNDTSSSPTGNPRQLSKKDKKKMQALRKL